MHQAALERHYDRSPRVIRRWLKLTGIKAAASPRHVAVPKRPAPIDFAEFANGKERSVLAAHYRASWGTINRWLDETSVEAVVRPTGTREKLKIVPAPLPRATALQFDVAADTLRRNRWVVYRCDDRGKFCEQGNFWRVGNVVCDESELLHRAARYEALAA